MAFPKKYGGFRSLENESSSVDGTSFGSHYSKKLNFKTLFSKSLKSKSKKR